ncbi:MAG: DUF4097 family beta strand repeat-containing protein, partial [Candidatus Sulfotelmatobacter sp.]
MKHTATERWLFIGLILSGFVCSWAAVPARADEWSKTYNLTGQPDLRVETSDANLHVSTWDQSSIEARVIATGYKIAEDGIRIEEHQTGNVVEIDVRYPHRGVIINLGSAIGHRVDIAIHMPREGRVDLHTGDGKIDLGNFKGEMVLRSGDGSQEIDGVDGKLRATTGDGHIRANGRFDELELKTGDGRLDARAASGSALATGWRLESGDGTVTLEIPENLAADVDLHAGDGHIDLDIPVTTTGK